MLCHGLAFLRGKMAMQVNRRRGNARLLNGTVLGFVVMLGLVGLTAYLLFTVRSDLDIALQGDAEAAAEIDRQSQARSSAEVQVAALQQQQVALQQQVDAARIAKGVAEESAQRETTIRTAAEQQSIDQELAKIEAQQQVEQERQLRVAAEEEVRKQTEASQEANRATSIERLAKQQVERELASARTQARQDVAREQAMSQLLLHGVVTGLLTFTMDDLPDYAGEGVSEALQLVEDDLTAWNSQGFNVSPAGPQEDPDFTIGWLRDAGGHLDTFVGEGRRVLAPLGETNCNGEWIPYDAETVRRLLWHELGHVFGYGNSENPRNIMYPEIETKFAVDQTVDLVLAPASAGVVHTIGLCGGGTFTYVFEEPDAGNVYSIVILKPGVTPSGYYEEENWYTDCGSTPQLYTNECIVEDGAVMLVYTQIAVTRISGTISKSVDLPDINMEWDPATFRYNQAALQALMDMFG